VNEDIDDGNIWYFGIGIKMVYPIQEVLYSPSLSELHYGEVGSIGSVVESIVFYNPDFNLFPSIIPSMICIPPIRYFFPLIQPYHNYPLFLLMYTNDYEVGHLLLYPSFQQLHLFPTKFREGEWFAFN